MTSGEFVVGWIGVLTIASTEWHDSVSSVLADLVAAGANIREAGPADYESPNLVIDTLIVAYMAAQHDRVAEDHHLSETLLRVKPSTRALLVCAIDRTTRTAQIRAPQINALLADQASHFAFERYAFRQPRSDQHAGDIREFLTARLPSVVTSTTESSTIDPALTNRRMGRYYK